MDRSGGYSLYELLITLGVATILLIVGVPPLGELVARNRLVAEVNALHHVFHQGRREAIKRGLDLTLCQTADDQDCGDHKDWSAGWLLFVDADGDGRRDAGEPVIRRHRPAARAVVLSNRARYTLRGVRRRNTNGTFLVCDRGRRAEPRALIVSYTGRPRSAPGAKAPAALGCP